MITYVHCLNSQNEVDLLDGISVFCVVFIYKSIRYIIYIDQSGGLAQCSNFYFAFVFFHYRLGKSHFEDVKLRNSHSIFSKYITLVD